MTKCDRVLTEKQILCVISHRNFKLKWNNMGDSSTFMLLFYQQKMLDRYLPKHTTSSVIAWEKYLEIFPYCSKARLIAVFLDEVYEWECWMSGIVLSAAILKDGHEVHWIPTPKPNCNWLQGKTAVYLKCNESRFEPSANIAVFRHDYVAISSRSFSFSVLISLYENLLYCLWIKENYSV